MARDVKIPAAFFQSAQWQKQRVFSEAEALLDIITSTPQQSLFALAKRWSWHRQKVKRFLMKCDGFVTQYVTDIPMIYKPLREMCDAECDGFVTQSKEKEKTRKKEAKKEIKENKETINPLLSNESIPLTDFEKFGLWIKTNAPRVALMREQFSEQQFRRAKESMGWEAMVRLLQAMHNYEPLLKKNISAYLTLMNWWRRDNKDGNGNSQQPYRLMSYTEMLAVMDREHIPQSAFSPVHIAGKPKPMWVRLADKTKFNIPDNIAS